jgi:hypothetical protein
LTAPELAGSVAAMSKWALRASQYLLILTLMVSMGGHLALLQTIAWGNMLISFSSEATLAESLAKTFDGEHPCSLCKVVQENQGEEEKKSLVKSEMKVELAVPAPIEVPSPRVSDVVIQMPEYLHRCDDVYLAVPIEPPRTA